MSEEFEDHVELSALQRLSHNATTKAASLEQSFLSLLRYGALIFAALTLVGALGYLLYGAAQQFRQTEIEPKPVTIAAEEMTPATSAASSPTTNRQSDSSKTQKPTISAEVRTKTLAIYKAKFKTFERNGAKISDNDVINKVWSAERIDQYDALATGRLTNSEGTPLASPQAVMLSAIDTIDKVAEKSGYNKSLSAYRNAKKSNVCVDVAKTRSREVTGWDSSSTSCADWYYSPVGCRATRTIEEPYTEKSCSMKFPEDMPSPSTQLSDAVRLYAMSAATKIELAQLAAEEASAKNSQRKQEGVAQMGFAVKLFLAFMAVMFLYLFVAIERHHRSLRTLVSKNIDA